NEKFRVTLNTDNRLMSATTLSDEFRIAEKTFHLTFGEMEKITINSMKSAFIPYGERIRYIYDTIKPGFKSIREKYKIDGEAPYGGKPVSR
ncbi:MAG: hypothetical protein M1378_11390, partial [Bacteroidetes bacterium]|nr:hypothetical protein [Bacteroidota bacterium]